MPEVDGAYRLVASEMASMEKLVAQTLSGVDPFVEEVIRYSFRFGGKRLRPAILFLVGRAVGTISENHLLAASAIELVHTASLIHDDILDGASLRRHWATVNVRWNSQVGVLAGDMLLAQAMELMTRGSDLHGFRRLTFACKKTCEGELRQIGTVGRFDMSREDYFEMIAGKTAPLLACCAELGAHYSGADPETVERFRLFGHRLGLAFQVIDDILDLVGEAETTGKTLRTDLANRKPTLPLILYLRDATGPDREKTLQLLGSGDWDERTTATVVDRLCDSGAVEAAKRDAARLIEDAIDSIPKNSAEDAAAGLVSIARFIEHRRR